MAKTDQLIALLERYKKLGIDSQLDYEKFYLYSIITHSTAIEGSTVTEIENQLLFDEGISAKGKTIAEQMMNLDLKRAYEESIRLAKLHTPITVDVLKNLSRLVMLNTGSNLSYMSYQKVPLRLQELCDWLNEMRSHPMSMAERYDFSFEAHYRLVTIHPWADGNGRMARLIMNHIQFEFGLVPSKVLKEDKGDYINALIATREDDNMSHFTDFMAEEMIKTLSMDIESFLKSTQESGEKIENSGKKKLKSREKILALLKEYPEYSARKLAEEIGITPKAVEKQLANLKASGLIRREGPDKGGKWIIS